MTLRYDPDYVVAPGETLQEWWDENKVPRASILRMTGLTDSELDGILAGTLRISYRRADCLARLPLGPSAQFWNALEHNYRVGLAAGKKRST